MPSSFQQLSWGPGERARPADVDGVTFVVRVGRYGVEPVGGVVLRVPMWLWSRVRWQFSSEQRWSVETLRMNRGGIGGTQVGLELLPTRSEATTRAEVLLAALRQASS